jgi:hypothetical protein
MRILLPFLIKHHIMKTYEGMEVNIHTSSTSVLFIGEGSHPFLRTLWSTGKGF